MSLRPGIGAGMMDEVASTLLTLGLENGSDDVPSSLQHGKRSLPLGRYLRRRLRTLIGNAPEAPASVINEAKKEMLPLRQAAWDSSTSFKTEVINAGKGKRANLAAKQRIFRKRGSI